MNKINAIKSFKGYVPVKYYAKSETDGKYHRICDEANLRKCHGYLIRNLNGTLKNKNEELIEFYKKHDSDYRNSTDKKGQSVYDIKNAIVHLFTGRDYDSVKQLAKPIGIAKSEAIERTGSSKSFESGLEAENYFKNVKMYIKNFATRLHNEKGEAEELKLYFIPQYSKKEHKLKGFEFKSARFVKANE